MQQFDVIPNYTYLSSINRYIYLFVLYVLAGCNSLAIYHNKYYVLLGIIFYIISLSEYSLVLQTPYAVRFYKYKIHLHDYLSIYILECEKYSMWKAEQAMNLTCRYVLYKPGFRGAGTMYVRETYISLWFLVNRVD